MGKGGEQQREVNVSATDPEISILLTERKKKIEKEPYFYWDDNTEPHAIRRRDIVKAHPEVKKLYGIDTNTKYKVFLSISLQIVSLHLLQGASWYTWLFCCYALSGSINHMMTLAMHEISHNLGATTMMRNRILAITANLPMGIPAAISFRRYHYEHHRFQGEDVVDVDIPTAAEGWFFTSPSKKTLWCLLQPVFYSLRPSVVNPKAPGKWEFINYGVCIVFDFIIAQLFGLSGLLYLVFGTLLGMGLHPVAGHFIAEHYVMHEGQETYSYYGPLNWLTFNVGYHNEHHDFPFVPGKNLPMLRKIAPEFYDDIPHYHSWSKVIYDYIVDTKINPFSRTKRVTLMEEEVESLRRSGGLIKS